MEALLTRLGFEVAVTGRDGGSDAISGWQLAPGATIWRKVLHGRYGGSRQGGISPSRTTPNVLIFTDLRTGQQHGYLDRWEGDTLHYYGEGQKGDQQMVRGNKAILNHVDDGRTLRVFDGVAGNVTYIGEFGLSGSDPWYWSRAPETGDGPLRDVVVFPLIPAGAF